MSSYAAKLHEYNPNVKFEVFLHKSDQLSDERNMGKEIYILSVHIFRTVK